MRERIKNALRCLIGGDHVKNGMRIIDCDFSKINQYSSEIEIGIQKSIKEEINRVTHKFDWTDAFQFEENNAEKFWLNIYNHADVDYEQAYELIPFSRVKKYRQKETIEYCVDSINMSIDIDGKKIDSDIELHKLAERYLLKRDEILSNIHNNRNRVIDNRHYKENQLAY